LSAERGDRYSKRLGPAYARPLLLRGDERKLDTAEAALCEVGRRHQGKLVDRQRPDGSPGHDESDPPDLTCDDLREQSADALGVGRAAEGQSAGDGRGWAGSAGDEQEVVRN
jgi:hypothetical protein